MNQAPVKLSMFELLDRSFQEIRKRFIPFFLLACLGPACSWLLMGLSFGFSPVSQNINLQNNPLLLMLIMLISALLTMFSFSSLVLYICKRAQSVREALALGLRRVPRLLWAGILMSIAVFLLLLVFLLPSITILLVQQEPTALLWIIALLTLPLFMIAMMVIGVYLCFWQYRLILTDEPFFVSLRSACQLVKGRFWETVLFLLVLTMINMAFILIFSMTFGLAGMLISLIAPALAWLPSLLSILLSSISALIVQVSMIALYLNRLSLESIDDTKDDTKQESTEVA